MDKDLKHNYNKFFIACRDNNIKVMKTFFDREYINGFKINDKCSENPLSIALTCRNQDAVNFLLENNVDINFLLDGSYVKIPIISRLIETEVDWFSNEYFNSDDGAIEEYEDKVTQNILELLKDTYFFDLLIQNNVDINLSTKKYGYTPLDIAHENNHKPAYDLIFENGGLHSKSYLNNLNDLNPLKDLLNQDKYIETKYSTDDYMPYIHKEINRIVKNKNILGLDLGFLNSNNYKNENPNEKDYLGRTAVDYAIELDHHLAVDYLRSVGGKTSKELEEEKND